MDSKTIIDRLGGPSEVSRVCGISPQAVSQWYGKDSDGRERSIPRGWLLYFKATRPEAFVDENAQAAAVKPGRRARAA